MEAAFSHCGGQWGGLEVKNVEIHCTREHFIEQSECSMKNQYFGLYSSKEKMVKSSTLDDFKANRDDFTGSM